MDQQNPYTHQFSKAPEEEGPTADLYSDIEDSEDTSPPSSPSVPQSLVRMPQPPPTLEELDFFDREPHPLTTSEQAAKPFKPRQSILEADYVKVVVDLLSSGEANDKADMENRASHPPTPIVAAAVPTTVPAATGPNTPPLALAPTLRLTLNVHAPSAPDFWFTSQTTPHINHSFRQAGFSDTVVNKLSRASGLLAAHGVLQLTQSAGLKSVTQQGGAGMQQAAVSPFNLDQPRLTRSTLINPDNPDLP